MKKILISSLFSICIALFMMVNVSSPLVAEEDEIIIFLGTQTFYLVNQIHLSGNVMETLPIALKYISFTDQKIE